MAIMLWVALAVAYVWCVCKLAWMARSSTDQQEKLRSATLISMEEERRAPVAFKRQAL
jgi:hypothetical protein